MKGQSGVRDDWDAWVRSERFVKLRATFEFLRGSSYEGIEGVVKIEGATSGPTVGVTACTHGNEPGGLAAAEYVLGILVREKEKVEGTIYVVLNNIRATEGYFSARNRDEATQSRMTELNMNRLPPESLAEEGDMRYEAARARRLRPLFGEFDAGLDIHTTLQESGAVIISFGEETPMRLIRGMPIDTIISNLDAVQVGVGIPKLFGANRPEPKRLGIEAGGHEREETFAIAVTCTRAFLRNTGVYRTEESDATPARYKEYAAFSSVVFPDDSYALVRLFNNYEFVTRGTLLAQGNGPDIVAPEDCHVLFGGKLKPVSIAEEAMFLAKPARMRTVQENAIV